VEVIVAITMVTATNNLITEIWRWAEKNVVMLQNLQSSGS
jgi:hypothetical protein